MNLLPTGISCTLGPARDHLIELKVIGWLRQ
jgi:hypothetical protein